MNMNNSHGEGNEGLEWLWAVVFGCCRRSASVDGRRQWWEEPLYKRAKVTTGGGYVGPGSFECYDHESTSRMSQAEMTMRLRAMVASANKH